jgi:hypothetical protein
MVVEPVAQAVQQEVLQPVMQTSVVSAQSTQPTQQLQPVQQTQQSAAAAGPGLGFALNLISRNADRERAVTQQAIQQATQDAAASTDRAVEQAVSIATLSSSGSLETTSTTQQNNGVATQNFAVRPTMGQQNTITGQETTVALVNQAAQVTQTVVQTATTQTFVATTQESAATVNFALTNQKVNVTPIEAAAVQNSVVQAQPFRTEDNLPHQITGNFLTDPVNPLRSLLDAQPQPQQEQPAQAAKAPVPDSTLAGGVTIAGLGGLPQGYNGYLQFQLQDSKFYDSRPIYQNQRVVDNVRVLRGLGSEQRHQDLVNLQYK